MSEVFIRRLRTMDGKAKDGLGEALQTASEPALVRSAFELSAAQRAAIQKALNETFAAAVRVRFETAPDLISGIELTTNGQKIAWSIADYLVSLEKGVGELLKDKDNPEAKTQATPEPNAAPKTGAKSGPKLRGPDPEASTPDHGP
jgi:F-type H+-transporting ATPase subunit b